MKLEGRGPMPGSAVWVQNQAYGPGKNVRIRLPVENIPAAETACRYGAWRRKHRIAL